MKDSVTVILSERFSETFQRTVTDATGQEVERMIFTRGEPVEVPRSLYSAIADDIGNALLVCTESKGGTMRGDYDATDKFKEYLSTPETKSQASQKSRGRRKKSAGDATDEPAQQDGTLHDESVSE